MLVCMFLLHVSSGMVQRMKIDQPADLKDDLCPLMHRFLSVPSANFPLNSLTNLLKMSNELPTAYHAVFRRCQAQNLLDSL